MPSRPARAAALLVAAFGVAGACSREQPQGTVALVHDAAALSRLADDEHGKRVTRGDVKRREQEAQLKFEQQREALRQRDAALRERSERNDVTDPYSMPFVPPESPGTPKPKVDEHASIGIGAADAASESGATHQ
jgi:hypothetical protein